MKHWLQTGVLAEEGDGNVDYKQEGKKTTKNNEKQKTSIASKKLNPQNICKIYNQFVSLFS